MNSPQVIDKQAWPDEVVEALHDGAGEEQHETPLLDEHHLALDVEGLVNILEVLQLQLLWAFVAAVAVILKLVDLIKGGELEHAVQSGLNDLMINSMCKSY